MNTKTVGGVGCLMLFALPFSAIGVGALGWTVWTLATWASMQSWREVPARIEQVQLVSSHSDKSTTYHVEAAYYYRWDGCEYRGDRVSMYSANDNLGSFHQRVAAELEGCRDRKVLFRCYVNPNNPLQVVLYRNLRIEVLGAMLLVCLLFGGAGFGIMIAGLYGRRIVQEQEALRQQYSGEPWRWRREWDKGVISAHTKGRMVATFIFATFWNLVSAPLLFFVPGEVRDGNYAALIGLLFPLVGAGLLGAAIYLALQWRRYGATVFEMASLPGAVGGLLRGRVRIPAVVLPEEDACVALDCVNRRTTGSGKNRSTSETIVWQAETAVPRNGLVQESRATLIPVEFVIPVDQPPTDDSNSDDQTLWRLRVKIVTSGVDFSANFEVPVFRIAESAATGAGPALGDAPVVITFDEQGNPVSAGSAPDPAMTGEALRRAGVLTEPCTGGGIALVFPMLRLPGMAFGMLVFTAVWGGVLVLMLLKGAPLLFPVVFGLFFLIMLYSTLDLFTGKSRIEVSRAGILARGGFFGLGPVRQLSFDEVGGLDTKRTMQAGNRLYYAVDLKKQGGGTLRVADRLRQEEARAVIQAIETAMGAYRQSG